MIDEDFAAAVTHIAHASSWVQLADAAFAGITALGGAGSSIGVLEDETVRQYARGFDPQVDERYALIPLAAVLPGPVAIRTSSMELFEDRAVALSKYPATAPILATAELEAAACLPLVAGGDTVGFLAAHYRGPRRFDPIDLLGLGMAAAACAGAVLRLRGTGGVEGHVSPRGGLATDASQAEIDGLRRAMASRASIEQAKGTPAQAPHRSMA